MLSTNQPTTGTILGSGGCGYIFNATEVSLSILHAVGFSASSWLVTHLVPVLSNWTSKALHSTSCV